MQISMMNVCALIQYCEYVFYYNNLSGQTETRESLSNL